MARPGRDALIGRVTAVHGRHYLVAGDAGGVYECVSRGRKAGLACGDRVAFSVTGPAAGAIEDTLPRRNLLYRSDHLRSKLFAANVDQVFIVTAAVPSPDIALLNRCLVACESAGVPAHIVVNKADLPETGAYLERLRGYARLGYPLILLSALQDAAPLRDALAGTAILIGASGVGKSTLVNALAPEAGAETQEISNALNSGRHTTTHTRLYRLVNGAELIDSPGMREFGLNHVDAASLQAAFPEFRERLGACRYYNCRHLNEPGCAILQAVESGAIDPLRWRAYRDLRAEIDRPAY